MTASDIDPSPDAPMDYLGGNAQARRDKRERLGRLVRETWVKWAREQPFPKLSWLVPWGQLGPEQREVDCRIGEAVAAACREDGWDAARDRVTEANEARRDERERCAQLAEQHDATYATFCADRGCQHWHGTPATGRAHFADLLRKETTDAA